MAATERIPSPDLAWFLCMVAAILTLALLYLSA